MSTILFDVFPATGHYNASFLLARQLAKTNRVVFVCEKTYEQMVRKMGFESFLIKRPILPNRFSVRFAGYYFYFFFYCLFRFHLKEDELYVREEKLVHKQMLEQVQPDLICLDSHHFYKKFLYNSYLDSGRLLRVQTMQSTLKYTYLFPICYDFIPKYTNSGHRLTTLVWKWYGMKSRFISYIDQILFPGKNMIYHLGVLSGYSYKSIRNEIDYNRYASRGMEFRGGKEIVIPPTVFNFPVAESVLSFKSILDEEKRPEMLSPRCLKCVDRVVDLRRQGKKVVYVSLGTLSENGKKLAARFFMTLKKVCNEMEGGACFIISISKNVFPKDFIPYSQNIFLFKRVPQLHLLQYCDLMITHGGMNSITECISNEVPMLVYPLDKHWDQPGNAARVVYHGMGLKGDMYWATPGSIKRKIEKIWDNYDFYKDNVRKMKARIAAEPDTAMDYINSLLV